MTGTDWQALARAVQQRRQHLRLTLDLSSYGGPGEITMRKIERAEGASMRNSTKTGLETALRWPRGTVDRVLAGETTPQEATALDASEVEPDTHTRRRFSPVPWDDSAPRRTPQDVPDDAAAGDAVTRLSDELIGQLGLQPGSRTPAEQSLLDAALRVLAERTGSDVVGSPD